MQKFLKNLFTAQRCRRAMFFLLFAAVMLLNSSPELRADALYLIADGDTVSVLDGTTDIPQERVIVTGAQSGDAEVTLPAGEKVTVTHGRRHRIRHHEKRRARQRAAAPFADLGQPA